MPAVRPARPARPFKFDPSRRRRNRERKRCAACLAESFPDQKTNILTPENVSAPDNLPLAYALLLPSNPWMAQSAD